MPWLLDTSHPNLQWRALVELVRRPADSPAVVRARGGSNAVEPVASLLADLQPNGVWTGVGDLWERWSGAGWRLLAAAQWGADPSDPRLHAAVDHLLSTESGDGGFVISVGGPPSAWLTARILQAFGALGWGHHSRFQEGLAWLDEAAPRGSQGEWRSEEEICTVTPVALLAALTASGDDRREALRVRSATAIVEALARGDIGDLELGHPNFDRTDVSEALWALARADATLDPRIIPALRALQAKQLDGGRWVRGAPVPDEIPVGPKPKIGEASRWLTLRSAVAVLHYAVEAELPRRYPRKPDRLSN